MIVKAEKAWHCADTVETMIVKAEKAWHSADTVETFPNSSRRVLHGKIARRTGKTQLETTAASYAASAIPTPTSSATAISYRVRRRRSGQYLSFV